MTTTPSPARDSRRSVLGHECTYFTRTDPYLRRLRASNPFRDQGLWYTTPQKFFAKSSTIPSKILESRDSSPSSTFAADGGAALSEIRPYGP